MSARAKTASEPTSVGDLADFLVGFIDEQLGVDVPATLILDALAVYGVVGASEEYMRRVSSGGRS